MSEYTNKVLATYYDDIKKLEAENAQLKKLLHKAIDHLDYCGYGDSWERECSQQLQKELDLWKEQQGEGE